MVIKIKKILKIIGIILVILVVFGLIFFIVDYNRIKNNEKPIFCIVKDEVNDGGTKIYLGPGYKVIDFHTIDGFDDMKIGSWFMKYEDFDSEIKEHKIEEDNKIHYSKTIDNTKIELDIPSEWNYEEMPKDEENEFYKYALKLYKNNENQYAMLYFYNDRFAVCGTGRTSEYITLNNGNEATIGYYYGSENWSDISFYKIHEYIAIMNYDLVDDEAKELIEFIKTINIINEQNEHSFYGTIMQVEENVFFVEPDEKV